jgi:hypothetical protein
MDRYIPLKQESTKSPTWPATARRYIMISLCGKFCVCWIALACILIPPCSGDILLEFSNRTESLNRRTDVEFVSDDRSEIWLGDGVARWNARDGRSYILDLRRDRFLVMYHSRKKYQIFQAPLILENLLKGEDSASYDEVKKFLKATVTIEDQEQPLFIEGRNVKFYHWSITHSAGEENVKAWTTKDIEVDEKLYDALLINSNTLNIATSQWFAQVAESPGVTVKYEVVTDIGYRLSKKTTTLVSVEEHPFSKSRYRAPEGYEKVDFKPSDVFSIVKNPPRKPRVGYTD